MMEGDAKSGQFAPGHKRSKGRSKSAKNVRTIAREVFFERMPYRKNGKSIKFEALKIMSLRMRAAALNGDRHATMNVVSILLPFEPPEQEAAPAELTEAKQQVLSNFLAMQEMLLPGGSKRARSIIGGLRRFDRASRRFRVRAPS
ncbi:DUF5681 domain-containing protein [Sphingomonas colocasiae]|uniref:DUF5681 domain-containing protein n=1 Tax=Sphingomonas colocasiae TaxID=1848973 RepID=A0ABS7PW93_9SPHN|nr:DUF5681 domain-containing protein [Sphingomonas colocasiae]MBY8824910.1 hypothetical protein [Sphingomonas colocasiae]